MDKLIEAYKSYDFHDTISTWEKFMKPRLEKIDMIIFAQGKADTTGAAVKTRTL